MPPDLLAGYLAGGFIWLLLWWLENKVPCPAEQMDAAFRQLTLLGLERILGGAVHGLAQ
jgi:hypothetical protein